MAFLHRNLELFQMSSHSVCKKSHSVCDVKEVQIVFDGLSFEAIAFFSKEVCFMSKS